LNVNPSTVLRLENGSVPDGSTSCRGYQMTSIEQGNPATGASGKTVLVHSRESDVGTAANPFVEIGSAIMWRDELAGLTAAAAHDRAVSCFGLGILDSESI
jgi:hypothetical protein